MALITCPDCSTEVSELAPACPICARPLAVRTASPVQTIEATGKTWKRLRLTAWLLLILGMSSCVASARPGNSENLQYGLLALGMWLVFGSVVSWWAGKIGAWWNHG